MTARSRPAAAHPRTVQGLLTREHAQVRHHLDHLRAIADRTPSEEPLMLRSRLDAVLSFLHNGATTRGKRTPPTGASWRDITTL